MSSQDALDESSTRGSAAHCDVKRTASRTPPSGAGPRTIRTYLQRQEHVGEENYHPPAVSTIYRYLRLFEYILPASQAPRVPLEPVPPLTHWQIDFKDVSSAEQEPKGKQQHHLEIFNVVDQGSSYWLHAEVRSDFTAETVIEAFVHAMQRWGVPQQITLDRDPRFVGSPQGSDFRSALLRFGSCLGIEGRGIASPPGEPS